MKIVNIPMTPQEVAAQIQAGEQQEAALRKALDGVSGNLATLTLLSQTVQDLARKGDSAALLDTLTELCLFLASIISAQHEAMKTGLQNDIQRTQEAVAALRSLLINAPAPERRQ